MDNIYDDFVKKTKTFKNKARATVVYLQGDLGSGKTTFTKNLCKHLDLNIDITSPTFTILKKYDFDVLGFKNLIHIDAYRLNSYQDLLKIKFDDYLKNKDNLIFIEWPEIIKDNNIKVDLVVKFKHVENNENERKIIIE